jgi:hypothetical protein
MLPILFLSIVAILNLSLAVSKTAIWSSFSKVKLYICSPSSERASPWAFAPSLFTNWFSVIDLETSLSETTLMILTLLYSSWMSWPDVNLFFFFWKGLSPPSDGTMLLFFDLEVFLLIEAFFLGFTESTRDILELSIKPFES